MPASRVRAPGPLLAPTATNCSGITRDSTAPRSLGASQEDSSFTRTASGHPRS